MSIVPLISLMFSAQRVAGLLAAEGPPASFVPENGLVCFQGPEVPISQAISYFRGGPLAKFSPHSGIRHNTTCASLGFTQRDVRPDACWPRLRKFFKPEVDRRATLGQIRKLNRKLVHTYADTHDIDREFAMKWTACVGGCGGGMSPGFRWWGADKGYSAIECKNVAKQSARHLARGKSIGAFTTDDGAICWQGPFDYMEAVLNRTQNTPYIHIFHNATVQEATCEQMGFDVVRDARDECWPESSKNMRSATEDRDMGEFVIGKKGITFSAQWYDFVYKLEKGTSLDWIICGACEKGGANRDRGMALTMNGAAYTDRYSDKYCSKLISRVGPIKELPPIQEVAAALGY